MPRVVFALLGGYGLLSGASLITRADPVSINALLSPHSAAESVTFQVAAGFNVERIYTVPKAEQGSWVSLTSDSKGRLIAGDQFGGLYRLTPPVIGSHGEAKVEKLKIDVRGAHGLLYAFDSLYVMVNEEPQTSGLWRLRDTDGDDQFDEKKLLRELKGRGEHGTHGLALSPDRKAIYFACGNDTKAPIPLEHSRPSRPLGEDQVVPRLKGGEIFSDKQPMAYTCRVDPDGQNIELVAVGLRNHYDIAFNALGDLFTYDSDMEWDAGTPWYRPTRICMLASGADFGFRDGSGKLPNYYPDCLPPIVDIGPGSPTGVTSGQGAKFPARYQDAIFVNDWTYGTMYAIHLWPEGAAYRAEKEEFIFGKPLPFTDVIVVPKDGAMYFTIGGRRTESALFRVTYVGGESTVPSPRPPETAEHKLRCELERLHDKGTGPEAIDVAWPYLRHTDRFVRWAARVAIEQQPVNLWVERALNEQNLPAFLEAAVALARMDGKITQPRLWDRLNAVNFDELDAMQQLALIRIYEISIARSGVPADPAREKAIERLDALYPASIHDLNRELSRTLVTLGSPTVVAKTMALMATVRDEEPDFSTPQGLQRNTAYGDAFERTAESRPNRRQIDFAYAMRVARIGWTPELRRALLTWFGRTGRWSGGNDFRPFLAEMRADALAHVPASERAMLEKLSMDTATPAWATKVAAPRGPGNSYTVEDALDLAKNGLKGRNFENGRNLFAATNCLLCHRFKDEGGGIGPDLTGAGRRYNLRDLLESIVEPSKVISDQYESTVIEKKDGSILIGLVTGEESGEIFLAPNAFARNKTVAIPVAEIEHRKPHPVSVMPPGLINGLNKDELLDLLAYILSAGDPKDKAFAPP